MRTTSSPFLMAASPPLAIRACAPVRSCTVIENDGSWPTSNTCSSPAVSSWRRTVPGEPGFDLRLHTQRRAGQLGRLLGAHLGRGEAQLEPGAERGHRLAGRPRLSAPALGERALVVGRRIGRLGMAQKPQHRGESIRDGARSRERLVSARRRYGIRKLVCMTPR